MTNLSVLFEEPTYLTREDAMADVDLQEHIREEGNDE